MTEQQFWGQTLVTEQSQDFYYQLLKYLLSEADLEICGFPLMNEQTGTVSVSQSSFFSSYDVSSQVCRCKKTISLLEPNWFLGKCQYHPLKVVQDSKRYKCCGRQRGAPGCVLSNVHTCSYFPLTGNWYKSNPPVTKDYCRDPTSILALDCEFIYTVTGMEVARVTLVSMVEGVIYDYFVKPTHQVLDFNTRFSGVKSEDLALRNVKTLDEVQFDLLQIISSETILIGHGLHKDLISLHFIHDKIVDTSIVFPHYNGYPYRYSLQYLASKYLGIIIHNEDSGHDSVEDAYICIQLLLYKLEFYEFFTTLDYQ